MSDLINRAAERPFLTLLFVIPLCLALPSWVGLVMP